MSDDMEYRIAKLKLEQGEVLVVKLDRRYPQEARLKLQAAIRAALPVGARVLILDSGCDISVLSREEIQRLANEPEAA
jgi:hypothetical protein